jgi:hypothetical protein
LATGGGAFWCMGSVLTFRATSELDGTAVELEAHRNSNVGADRKKIIQYDSHDLKDCVC